LRCSVNRLGVVQKAGFTNGYTKVAFVNVKNVVSVNRVGDILAYIVRIVDGKMWRMEGDEWALKPAWYLHFAPAVYWMFWWLIPTMALLSILIFIAFSHAFPRDFESPFL